MRHGLGVPAGMLFALACSAADTPLPDPQALRQRAITTSKKLEKDRENYSCTVQQKTFELNSDGSVKKEHSQVEERFYLGGIRIAHLLVRDGKDLTGEDARKEQERTDKEVKKYSDPKNAAKAEARQTNAMDLFLKAQRFSNGQREERQGRSVVAYDLAGDPEFRPRTLEERLAQAVAGRIWIDEESGAPQELRLETTHDVKVGGGLLADLRKGFQLHLIQQRQPDGVWLTKTVEGSGDAKAALFFHPRFRFREDLEKCHLFSVNTQQKVQSPKQ